jgi:hypothetical protein
MRNKLGIILGCTMIAICLIIFFSSCTNTQKVAMKTQKYSAKDSTTITLQMVVVDSLGIFETLPKYKGLKK